VTEADALAGVDPDRLPPQARRLVRIIGLPATVRLLQAFGGGRITIPLTADGAVTLRAVLSDAELAALAGSSLAGERLELPTAKKIARQLRNAQILADRQRLPLDQVARKWGLTRRQIINLSGAAQAAPCGEPPAAIHDLFDGA
jgi:hypothetical protein